MKKCEACGTTKNINGSLGGVLLCREHFADISADYLGVVRHNARKIISE